jgi:hypothetical protein
MEVRNSGENSSLGDCTAQPRLRDQNLLLLLRICGGVRMDAELWTTADLDYPAIQRDNSPARRTCLCTFCATGPANSQIFRSEGQ